MKDFYRNNSLKMQDQVFRFQVNVLFLLKVLLSQGDLLHYIFVSSTLVRILELDSSGSLGLLFLMILVRVQNAQDFGR